MTQRRTSSRAHSDLQVFGDAGRLLSFGLVGVSAPSPGTGPAFSRWLAAASSVADPRELASRTILTPSCGLGGSSVAEAERRFARRLKCSALVASVAQGDARRRQIHQPWEAAE